ncbi:hypothetical protein [Catalinimonas alkaloidigena]|uniref:hypothetical protein n=1 Tax=Catalinimonas alkaloidigena TaxID=1075417 RepID=UPI0024062DC0|nr:hypothetical protein [Catalinimonas alkaloidigena]
MHFFLLPSKRLLNQQTLESYNQLILNETEKSVILNLCLYIQFLADRDFMLLVVHWQYSAFKKKTFGHGQDSPHLILHPSGT